MITAKRGNMKPLVKLFLDILILVCWLVAGIITAITNPYWILLIQGILIGLWLVIIILDTNKIIPKNAYRGDINKNK